VDLFSHAEAKEKGPGRDALTVTRLLRRMRNLLEIEIGEVWVEGEVSNLRKQGSGHWYFSLKDEGGQLACAMFSARRREGHAVLEDGAKVRLRGEVTLYEARGATQLVVREVEAAGAGTLQAQFEALKKRLADEGLFDESRKKKIPKFPRRIGVVTSASGAALQDMLNVLGRRAPWIKLHLADVKVQGKGAELGIARAIEKLGQPEDNGWPNCDVIIVGRGGGSIEDLWNFNEEIVARAVAASKVPVVSAVGHEIDFTIVDFAADLRAPTPSAAAELVVPDREELLRSLASQAMRLKRRSQEEVASRKQQVGYLERLFRSEPEVLLRQPLMKLAELQARLERSQQESVRMRENKIRELRVRWEANQPEKVIARRHEANRAQGERLLHAVKIQLQANREKLARLRSVLQALGPESALERGFSITLNEKGEAVSDPKAVAEGEILETVLHKGRLSSRVERTRNE